MSTHHLEALNLVRNGNWHEAHQLIQPYSDKLACLIHGYLHRIEGDMGNAQYWYNRANETMPANSLEQELERLNALEQQ
jgi:hypothetical protein